MGQAVGEWALEDQKGKGQAVDKTDERDDCAADEIVFPRAAKRRRASRGSGFRHVLQQAPTIRLVGLLPGDLPFSACPRVSGAGLT